MVKINLNFEVGIENSLKITSENTKYPGAASLDMYNFKYLEIKNVKWCHLPNGKAELNINVIPLKQGKTVAIGHIQLDEFNPLFETIVFDITIS